MNIVSTTRRLQAHRAAQAVVPAVMVCACARAPPGSGLPIEALSRYPSERCLCSRTRRSKNGLRGTRTLSPAPQTPSTTVPAHVCDQHPWASPPCHASGMAGDCCMSSLPNARQATQGARGAPDTEQTREGSR
jgi:hypothetical protein